jgi:hypothetical protein
LAENQRILATCDTARPPAAWVDIDATGSSTAQHLFEERMSALQSIAQRTAVCGGYLQVNVFTSDSAATTTVFDGSLRQPGATTNARLQRVPGAVTAVMATVRQHYAAAVNGLDPRDSDITGQYQLAADWFRQLGGSYRLHAYLLTDGFQTAGINLYTQLRGAPQATALAQQAPATVPLLPGAAIVVAGLGREAGTTPPSDVVTGLIAYYNALCDRMQATSCTAVTDYQVSGQ